MSPPISIQLPFQRSIKKLPILSLAAAFPAEHAIISTRRNHWSIGTRRLRRKRFSSPMRKLAADYFFAWPKQNSTKFCAPCVLRTHHAQPLSVKSYGGRAER